MYLGVCGDFHRFQKFLSHIFFFQVNLGIKLTVSLISPVWI
jgi:hypothetical protein